MLKFDETRLLKKLASLEVHCRVAFAAACATRLLPVFEEYAGQHAPHDSQLLRRALDLVWGSVIEDAWQQNDVEKALESVEKVVPEEADNWTLLHAYAEDAVAATQFSLSALVSNDPQESAWAARRAYSIVDQAATSELVVDFRKADAECRILSHPLVQQELTRQMRDLHDLEGATRNTATFKRMRDRALSQNILVLD